MHSGCLVEGIDARLTVPSRNLTSRFDFWATVSWENRDAQWEHVFHGLIEGARTSFAAAHRFELFPMSLRRGWVVARGVDVRLVSADDVEAMIRDMVAQANAQLADHGRAPSAPAVRERRGLVASVVASLGPATPRRSAGA